MNPPEIVDPTENNDGDSLVLDSHDLPHIVYRHYFLTESELRYAYVPWIDKNPPVSNVLPVFPYWNGNPIQSVATDASGIANVTLWYRRSSDNSTPWGACAPFSD